MHDLAASVQNDAQGSHENEPAQDHHYQKTRVAFAGSHVSMTDCVHANHTEQVCLLQCAVITSVQGLQSAIDRAAAAWVMAMCDMTAALLCSHLALWHKCFDQCLTCAPAWQTMQLTCMHITAQNRSQGMQKNYATAGSPGWALHWLAVPEAADRRMPLASHSTLFQLNHRHLSCAHSSHPPQLLVLPA